MTTSEMIRSMESAAADIGFCEFQVVPADRVIFSDTVRILCEQECQEAGMTSHSLPPAVGTAEECRARCLAHEHVILLSAIFPTEDIADLQAWMEAGVELDRMLLELEERAKAFTDSCLILGMRCRRCPQCAWPEPCRHPETLVPASEGYGVQIMNTMEEAGITGYYDGQTIVCFGLAFFR